MRRAKLSDLVSVIQMGMIAFASGAVNLSPVNTPPPAASPLVDPDRAVLRWVPGTNEVRFIVYLGTTSLEKKAYIAGEKFAPADLDPDTYYQWRVDAYNVNRDLVAPRGTVWQFKTGPGDSRKAHMPQPVIGGTVTSAVENVLRWSTGTTGASFNVYFGKDSSPDETEFRGNLTNLYYSAGIPAPNTKYYWRIDTVTGDGTIVPGRVWNYSSGYSIQRSTNALTLIYADEFENGELNDPPFRWVNQNVRAQLCTVSGRAGKSVKLNQSTWIEKAVSTWNMSGIQVIYQRSLSGFASGESLTCEWSADGVVWHPLVAEQTGTFDDPLTVADCDPAADRQSGFRIRFRTDAADTGAYALLDSVRVTGLYAPVVPERDPAHNIAGAKVIFLGDSLTSNTNGWSSLPDPDGKEHWTAIVQRRFNLQVLSAHASNPTNHLPESRSPTHGKGGSRAYLGAGSNPPDYYGSDAADPGLGGYQRIKYAFQEAVQGVNDMVLPEFVIINFGMNDHKRTAGGVNVSTPEDFNHQLKLIVDLVRQYGSVPVLVTPHDFYQGSSGDFTSYYSLYDPELFNNAGDHYSALGRFHLFLDETRKVAAGSVEEGRAPVDLIELNMAAAEYDPDEFTVTGGVHLEKLGYDVYAQVIGDYLSARYGDGSPALPPPEPPELPPPAPIAGSFTLKTGGSWAKGANWTQGQPPSDINSVYIRSGLSATLTTDAGAIAQFYLGDNSTKYSPGSGFLNIFSGGKLVTTNDSSVGRQNAFGAEGELNLFGGLLQLGDLTGNCVLKIGVDNTTAPVGGRTIISGGEFRGRILLGSTGISNVLPDQLRIVGDTAIIGSTATTGPGLEVGDSGAVEYVFNASGVSCMNFSQNTGVFHSGSAIIVDGAAYKGGAADFTLLQCASLSGIPEIILQNCPDGTVYEWSAGSGAFTVFMAAARTAQRKVPLGWYEAQGITPESAGVDSWEVLDEMDLTGQGRPNWQVYLGGTDPRDPSAIFEITEFYLDTEKKPQLRWQGGLHGLQTPYVIEKLNDLKAGQWVEQDRCARRNGINEWQGGEAVSAQRSFFRVRTLAE